MPTLSIIIPTLNEALYLPKLLGALKNQTQPADEIIVADAHSTDATVKIAKQAGARVVRGGMPGVGRNAGARVAKGKILLFLDADVLPPRDFIKKTVKEFVRSNFAVATCLTTPIDKKLDDLIIMEAANLYMKIVEPLTPKAPGFCIFVKKTIHKKINGFDESLVMNEDHDYVQRAGKYGKFGFLSNYRIPVSMRRLEKEGLIPLAYKYIWTELNALAGKPVHSIPFRYEFGSFDNKKDTNPTIIINVKELRTKLGKYSNPVLHFSKKRLDEINTILELDVSQLTFEQIKLLTQLINKSLFYQYINKRLLLISKSKPVRYSWKKIKSFPEEFIRILNTRL